MTTRLLNKSCPVWVMAAWAALTSPLVQASEIQVGRYTLQSTAPTEAQVDLLAATLNIRFPDHIQTIGEAVDYLLQRSGYRLADPTAIDPAAQALLALPLPTVHRHLGPMPLHQALETLAGPAFRLIQDPVHRLVSFKLCAKQGGK